MKSSLPLTELLRKPGSAGLHSATAQMAERALQAARDAGFNVWHVDVSATDNATALLKLIGRSLHFPAWYGVNWDALADCLADLSWCDADGHVLLLHGIDILRHKDAAAVANLLNILSDVSAIWREGNVAFWVLIDTPIDDVPSFPAHA